MNRIMMILLLSNVILFGLLVLFGQLFVEKRKKVRSRFHFHAIYPLRSWLYMILASFFMTLCLSQITFSRVTNVLLFLTLVALCPAIVSSELKRREQEEVFTQVILYCHNMSMLLKQNHNVYSSLERVVTDLEDPLRSDLENLLKSLEEGKEASENTMRMIEKKYAYSCIKNLDVILTYMFFENSHISSALLDTFQDDIEKLDQDVKENRSKRKTLRLQYILITFGSMLAYWFMLRQIQISFAENLNNLQFKQFNALYIFTTLFSLFVVDRYFNANITRE